MKLYLSSYHLGNQTEKFIKMFSDNRKIAVIANALDFVDEDYRKESNNNQINDLTSLGLIPQEIDLRDYIFTPLILPLSILAYCPRSGVKYSFVNIT